MLFVSLFAAFVPARVVGEMTSIGTLFAFILVCIGVWVMRKKPDPPRAFKTPLGSTGSYSWHIDLPVYDGISANGYLDPFAGMDADRVGYLHGLWYET